MQLDFRVMDLLASKLCHDLISPVSAINNGVELIEDIGESVMEDAMKLIGDSAGQASRRLRLFRVAYGRAGSEENLPLRDVKQIVMQYMAAGKVALTWEDDALPEEFIANRGALKVLVNLLILVEEILPYGGSVRLTKNKESDSPLASCGCLLAIKGRAVRMSEPFQAAIEGETPVEDLTPRTIQPYITGRYAACFGLKISSRQTDPEALDMRLVLARREYDENPPS